MPVGVARKAEFLIRKMAPHLDIQLHPIALTVEQCVEFRLPSIPMKDQHRGPAFVQRFGRGPTELDALEALHPGKLEELVEEWIARYHDHSLNDRIDEVVEQVKTDLTPIHDQVRERHADAIASVKSQLRQAKKQIKATIKAFEKNARPILRAIEQDLNAAAPDVDSYDWPEPEEGDAIVDPLFDLQRDYLDQIDRYKEHQRKPTEGKGHSAPRTGKMHMVKCLNCPNEFEARRSDTQFCSGKCRSEYQRKRDRGEAPPRRPSHASSATKISRALVLTL